MENYGSGQCIVGTAQETGLEEGCASVVFGEAMLTMQTVAAKQQIVKEAYRLLEPGGRYGVHETCLIPKDLPEKLKKEIELALTKALRVGARPLTIPEWRELLEESGFSVRHTIEAPMLLLNPLRIIQDDGLLGTMQFVSRVVREPVARRRIMALRRTFGKYSQYIKAVTLVAEKPA